MPPQSMEVGYVPSPIMHWRPRSTTECRSKQAIVLDENSGVCPKRCSTEGEPIQLIPDGERLTPPIVAWRPP